jgi:hypothetical protein
MLLLPIEATAMRPSAEFSLIGTLRQGLDESTYFTLTETYSSRHDHQMPALLLANKR